MTTRNPVIVGRLAYHRACWELLGTDKDKQWTKDLQQLTLF